jgi:predicted TPR repeat methyltransferase
MSKPLEVPLSDLSIPEAFACAIQLQQEGYLPAAETIYQRILTVVPNHPDALHFLGLIARQRGDREGAVALIRQALSIAPEYADAHNNLGNILLEMERFSDAEECLRKVIALKPEHANAYNNLGILLKAQENLAEAEAMFGKAIEFHPDFSDAYHNLGNTYRQQGRHSDAINAFSKAIVLDPTHSEARQLMGMALYTLGRTKEAADHYRNWLVKEPQHPIPAHMLAACSGEDVPPRASDNYISRIFDNFAESFDAKLSKLHYRAPELVADAVSEQIEKASADRDVLDLGCGTGLCGPLLKPYAKRLIGVDLSAGMLAKAKTRQIYDQLIQGELSAYLSSQNAACDLIASADTLCYLGELGGVFAASAQALRSNGLLVFTVENNKNTESTQGFQLGASGRYSHTENHIRDRLQSAGLSVTKISPVHLRMENCLPVEGLLVVASRPS